jgi:hypothetical protein
MLMKGDERHSFWPHCTVTLIKPGIALTARHCVQGLHGLKLKLFFQFEGFREVDSSQILIFCNQTDANCSRHLDDLAVIKFPVPLAIVSSASMSELSKMNSRTVATIVGFGGSDTYVSDNGIKRSGNVMLSECGSCRSTGAPPKWTTGFPSTICFDSTVRTSNTESVNWVSSQPGDSGGPMLFYDQGFHQLIGLARGTGWACSDEAHSESRFVNLLDPRFQEWLSGISSDSNSISSKASRNEVLLAVESAMLDHEDPIDRYELEIGPLASKLIVTMNHSVGGWNPAPADLDLLMEVNTDCTRFVGAEVCSIKNPTSGIVSMRVQRVHRQADYQLTAVVEYKSPKANIIDPKPTVSR